ncbi:immunity protein Imm33 domain-containing protein [Nocardioides bruguierae]|uniref:immunity protein Imm33 domain-containing protein n=1 Tax=Nocardioides bruguierae TaxID=2945102 RepID=UPI0020203FD9|nr:DUF2185 domain-containing protein [Nocardioides bruguierae]MCL8026745.1 DUF2185 domain-containing protein [Nocardioides bruguierae]
MDEEDGAETGPRNGPRTGAALGVSVSRRVHEGEWPGYVVRDEPLGPHDSGWQLLVGDETPAELDDPFAIAVLPLAEVARRWPALAAVLRDGPLGGEWVRDAASGRYVPRPGEA